MTIGTTEAASLLGICCQRLRQLLAAGRVRGAEKVGRTWKIPLFDDMPQIIPGSRGPDGTWKKKLQACATYIHVIRQNFVQNQKDEQNRPVIKVNQGKHSKSCHEVEILGPCRLVYRPHQAKSSGAKLWIEVDPSVEIKTIVFA